MPCLYCVCYAQSLRRIGTDEEGSKSKKKGRRICATTRAWKAPDDEICDEFQPVITFWCDKLQQNMHVDACRNKKLVGKKPCKRCWQNDEILDVIRARARVKKEEVETQPEPPKDNKPSLLRRKK